MTWNVDVQFKRSSIHGTGVYANQLIPAETKVWTFDKSMNVCECDDLSALSIEKLQFALHGGYFHQPSGKFIWYEDGMQYVNHADTPSANIGIREWTALQDDNCTALRDIAPGEELLEDYSFWSIFSLDQDHWLRLIYEEFCPGHYAFLQDLHFQTRKAA